MGRYHLSKGEGRTKVKLSAWYMGNDLVVCICNDNAHIGAVALGDYDHASKRTSTSVITRLGHKDDAVAQQTAYIIGKSMKRPVCVIAGIHIDNITKGEINEVLNNTEILANGLTIKLLVANNIGKTQ